MCPGLPCAWGAEGFAFDEFEWEADLSGVFLAAGDVIGPAEDVLDHAGVVACEMGDGGLVPWEPEVAAEAEDGDVVSDLEIADGHEGEEGDEPRRVGDDDGGGGSEAEVGGEEGVEACWGFVEGGGVVFAGGDAAGGEFAVEDGCVGAGGGVAEDGWGDEDDAAVAEGGEAFDGVAEGLDGFHACGGEGEA